MSQQTHTSISVKAACRQNNRFTFIAVKTSVRKGKFVYLIFTNRIPKDAEGNVFILVHRRGFQSEVFKGEVGWDPVPGVGGGLYRGGRGQLFIK